MFAIDQTRTARFADQPAGSLVALRYSQDGRQHSYHLGLITAAGGGFPSGVLVFSGNQPPTFIRPTGYCLLVSDAPVFAWSGEVTVLSSRTESDPSPGDMVMSGNSALICGVIAGQLAGTNIGYWDPKSGELVETPVGDAVFTFRQWNIRIADPSKQLKQVFQFSRAG